MEKTSGDDEQMLLNRAPIRDGPANADAQDRFRLSRPQSASYQQTDLQAKGKSSGLWPLLKVATTRTLRTVAALAFCLALSLALLGPGAFVRKVSEAGALESVDSATWQATNSSSQPASPQLSNESEPLQTSNSSTSLVKVPVSAASDAVDDTGMRFEYEQWAASGQTVGDSVERVKIWNTFADSCRGTFLLRAPSQNGTGLPAMLLRQAAVDRRFVVRREYRSKRHEKRPFRRVSILLTAIPHGEAAIVDKVFKGKETGYSRHTMSVHYGNGSRSDAVKGGLDFVINDIHCSLACKKYNPCRNRETQLILTIAPNKIESTDAALRNAIESIAETGGYLKLALIMSMASGAKEILPLQIGLTCISGLTSHSALPFSPRLPERQQSCDQAKGAVMISGGPLFGSKRLDPTAWREIAHYAVRSLYGHVWYDTVAVGVIPEYTMAEMMHKCKNETADSMCVEKLHEKNKALLRRIRDAVESEFAVLQVPKADWSRLYIFLFCSLGSDFADTEANNPCDQCHHAGQKLLQHFGYTVFSPHHRWASNMDLDEFAVDETLEKRDLRSWLGYAPEGPTRYESATDRFDHVISSSKKYAFRMPWFDFRVSPERARDLAAAVASGQGIPIQGFNGSTGSDFNRTDCYMAATGRKDTLWGGGKVAQHCFDGMGFMVHDSWNVWDSRNSLDLGRTKCQARVKQWPPKYPLFTYHARGLDPRFGRCEFINATKR